MFVRVPLLGAAVLGAALLTGVPAGAVTAQLEFDRFGRSEMAAAHAAKTGYLSGYTLNNRREETFEGYAAWNGSPGTSDPKNTAVGSFSAYGHAGSGGSVIGDGAKTQVRGDTMPWGRYSTAPSAGAGLSGNWLDSNDNTGMTWEVAGIGPFNLLAFYVTDAADVGGRFSIKVGDTLFSDPAGGGAAAARLRHGARAPQPQGYTSQAGVFPTPERRIPAPASRSGPLMVSPPCVERYDWSSAPLPM